MTDTQTLLNRRANLWSQLQEIDAKPRDTVTGLMTVENATAYDQLDAAYDELEAEIERDAKHTARANALNAVDRSGVQPPLSDQAAKLAGDEKYKSAFDAYIRNRPLTNEQQTVLFAGLSELPQGAAGVGTGSAGGYLVPPEFRQKLIEQVTFVAAMRQFAEVITTDTGANLPWPTVDDTAQEGAILGENTQISEQDVTFGQNSLDAYMYTSKLVRVSLQLLNDNAFNLNSWLPTALGARIGRIQNKHFTIGTGTAQPDGLFVSATVGKQGTTGQTLTVIYDDLVDLTDSIDASYINSNSRWMMAQATRKVVRKLKDTQNRPLWEPSLQVGMPDNLMGYPVSLNNYAPAPGVSAKSIAFGDIKAAYVVRDVGDLSVARLTERYMDLLQVGFFAFQRSDGTLQNASAVKLYQHSAT